MNPWSVTLTRQAQPDIPRLSQSTQVRVLNRLEWLGDNAALVSHQAMNGEWDVCYRFRVGDYRAIHALDWPQQELTVLKTGHRRDIYR